MDTLKFKTSLKCDNCVAKITPYMDDISEIVNWKVDLEDPNKVLTAQGENLSPDKIEEALAEAGYTSELLK